MPSIQIDTSGTQEKYIPYTEKICPWFIVMMQKYVERLQPLLHQYQELFKKNKDGAFSNDISILTSKMVETKVEILSGLISNTIYISPYDTVPFRFDYFTKDCSLKFVMKSMRKALIIAHFVDVYGCDAWHKYEFAEVRICLY